MKNQGAILVPKLGYFSPRHVIGVGEITTEVVSRVYDLTPWWMFWRKNPQEYNYKERWFYLYLTSGKTMQIFDEYFDNTEPPGGFDDAHAAFLAAVRFEKTQA